MRRKGALSRGMRRAASVFVALACVFVGFVQAQTAENKAVEGFVVEPGGVVRIKGKADLTDIAAANEAAKAKRAGAKAKAGEMRSSAQEERVLETRAVFYPTELAWGTPPTSRPSSAILPTKRGIFTRRSITNSENAGT